MKSDVTVEILKDIRSAARETNARLDEMNARLGGRLDEMDGRLNGRIDGTNAALDTLREELSRRIVESEVRTSTAITDLAGTVREVATLVRNQHDLRPRVERCETEIAELKRRLPAND